MRCRLSLRVSETTGAGGAAGDSATRASLARRTSGYLHGAVFGGERLNLWAWAGTRHATSRNSFVPSFNRERWRRLATSAHSRPTGIFPGAAYVGGTPHTRALDISANPSRNGHAACSDRVAFAIRAAIPHCREEARVRRGVGADAAQHGCLQQSRAASAPTPRRTRASSRQWGMAARIAKATRR